MPLSQPSFQTVAMIRFQDYLTQIRVRAITAFFSDRSYDTALRDRDLEATAVLDLIIQDLIPSSLINKVLSGGTVTVRRPNLIRSPTT